MSKIENGFPFGAIFLSSLLLVACGTDQDSSVLPLDERFNDSQLEQLVVEAENVLSKYPAALSQNDDLDSLPPAGGVHITYWRDGNRIGRGFSAASNTVLATREAAWEALKNVKDPRRLKPHVVLVDSPKLLNKDRDKIGIAAFAVRSANGNLKPVSIMPPAMAIEDGRSWSSLIARLQRWTADGSDLVALDAVHVARNGSQQVTRRSFAADRTEKTDLVLIKARLVEWLRENQKQSPWGYPSMLQPRSGRDSIRPDLTGQLRLALAASALQQNGPVTYFQHQADLQGIEKRVGSIPSNATACLSCESDDALMDTSLALLIFARSEQISAESRVGQALASYLSKQVMSDAVWPESQATALAYAYVALREWHRLTRPNDEVKEELTGVRDLLLSHLTKRAAKVEVADAAFWAELQWLSPDPQTFNPVVTSALRTLRDSATLDLELTSTAAVAALASHEGDRYFDEALSRQYLFSDTYFCPQRFQCLGGVKSSRARSEVSAAAWWAVFMMLERTRSDD